MYFFISNCVNDSHKYILNLQNMVVWTTAHLTFFVRSLAQKNMMKSNADQKLIRPPIIVIRRPLSSTQHKVIISNILFVIVIDCWCDIRYYQSQTRNSFHQLYGKKIHCILKQCNIRRWQLQNQQKLLQQHLLQSKSLPTNPAQVI